MTFQGSLEINNLAVIGPNGPIVSSISFDTRPGELVALVGPSGSGKTTILNAIAGSLGRHLKLVGNARLNGRSIWPYINRDDNRAISVISQRPLDALNPVLSAGTILGEIARGRLRRSTRDERRRAVRTALAEVGLSDVVMDSRPAKLSGGERQRVLFAAALIGNPDLILADEPTSAMDLIARRDVFEQLRGIARQRGIPVVVATHDRSAVRRFCDRAIVLSSGLIERVIPAEELDDIWLQERTNIEVGAPILEVAELGKAFGSNRVFDRLSFKVCAGARVGLVGRSGCGKSTLARCLAGLIVPDTGSISLITPSAKTKVVGPSPEIQMIFQEPHASFDPRLSLAESLTEVVRLGDAGLDARSAVHEALSLLAGVGIDNRTAYRRPGEVSGGECQRAAIARALARPTSMLIADEPTSGLDYEWSARILGLLNEAQRRHRFALLMISHNIRLLSVICNEIAVMHGGRIVECGPFQQTIEKSAHPATTELVEAAYASNVASNECRGERQRSAHHGNLQESQ